MWKSITLRLALAWMLSIPAAFFALGFLSNYYATFIEIVLITVLVQSVAGLMSHRLLGRAGQLQSSGPADLVLAAALIVVLAVFVMNMFRMANQFPRLFDVRSLLLEDGQIIPFTAGILLALPALAWGVRQGAIEKTRIFQIMDEILAGVLVAGFFFAIYFIFASIFNRPAFDVDDIFFDADGLLWRTRFTTDVYRDYYWRPVHPFVLLIVRPFVTLVSFFLRGDKLAAAFLLIAFAGAACVFLAWFFVKKTVGNSLYAALMAALLGASSAHLVFGSLIETYILLAAVMMVFLVGLLEDAPLFVLVMTGLLSFGITLTNFVQTAIAFLFVKQAVREWIKYCVIVAALTVPLSVLNNTIYPDSQPYFFDPASFRSEAGNTFVPSVHRGLAVLRVMFFDSIVAPDPLILHEEIPFLKVWIFKADPVRLSGYETWFGSALAFIWLAFLLLGGYYFLRNFKHREDRFSFAFILILIFNFLLHLRYGKDIFLYSTNWTYAIILSLALACRQLADKRWFQSVLLVFLALLLANNSRLIYTMLRTSALHIK